MTFIADRANRREKHEGLFGRFLERIAVKLDRARKDRRGVVNTTIRRDETPEHVLRDIGLLDGRQVIPLRLEESSADRWR